MPLHSMLDMMRHAQQNGYGLGYFEAWDTYSMEAVLEAAEEENSPVILGFGGMMLDTEWLDEGGVALMGAIGGHYARKSRVPVSLILNEAQTMEQVVQG
ncbi:MAG: class II fructose-bisphosphate aldolase, partial [Armatimonadetes bacterium]|nr:class II fructose-bisphosphate aldolase [Armatimonadota bacterium]